MFFMFFGTVKIINSMTGDRMKASTLLTEKEIREIFERGHSYTTAMTGVNRIGRGGKPTSDYFRWLEWWVRAYWPVLSKMREQEQRREIDQMTRARRQTCLPIPITNRRSA